jgi:hypothetical protein
VAWDESTEPIVWEQGLDASLLIEMFGNTGMTTPWPFPGWDVNSVLSDGRTIHTLTTIVDAIAGTIRVIAPEALVNSLKPTKTWHLNVLMVAPGNVQADDHHVLYRPVTLAARPARRDP